MIDALDVLPQQALQELDPERTLVLSVNNRLARRILTALSESLGGDRRVMAVPDIVPLAAWLRRALDELSFVDGGVRVAAHTLDTFASQYLWHTVISDLESDHILLDTSQAARLAAEADRLLDDWRIRVPLQQETPDYQRFKAWREAYRARLADDDMEDANLGWQRVLDAVEQSLLDRDFDTVVLAGFQEASPRFTELLDAWHQQGVRLLRLEAASEPAQIVRRVETPDPDAEWRMAAAWAAETLSADPNARVALIAARLETNVPLAHRCLRGALAEARLDATYNIAVGRPLSEWPLARAALAWLHAAARLAQGRAVPPADLGQALLAGACAGGASEASGRARIDAAWRHNGVLQVSPAAFQDALSRHTPRLGAAWQACLSHARTASATTADVWAERFRQWLDALGFPGGTALDSHAYQVLDAFDSLLGRLGRQAAALGSLPASAALGLLSKLARDTLFQPQRDPDARLDVLGFLEAEGGRWDGVWILGLTDEVLPAPPSPNPFVPLAALRSAGAPRATPERELEWAKRQFASLLACAPQAWLSHPLFEGERELRPSPCIAGVPAADWWPSPVPVQRAPLESLIDDQGPALQAGAVTRGGIGVIDTQARNPLWAFAKYRLGARLLPDYADLADQNARGLFLHRAMELLWRLLPDQHALRQAHAEGRLEPLVEQVVAQAAQECLADYGETLRELESRRARLVLEDWLALERERESFGILEVEQDHEWSHGPLQLRLRIDRIDTLHDGRLAVIDYKTGNGNVDPKPNWMRERPVGLQLPFYAAVLAGAQPGVGALVLAKLHARQIQVKGLSDGDCGFPGVADLRDWPAFADLDWDGLMAQWRRTIESLAAEYAAGAARNHSLKPSDIEYCDVLPFLRLTEDRRDGQATE